MHTQELIGLYEIPFKKLNVLTQACLKLNKMHTPERSYLYLPTTYLKKCIRQGRVMGELSVSEKNTYVRSYLFVPNDLNS